MRAVGLHEFRMSSDTVKEGNNRDVQFLRQFIEVGEAASRKKDPGSSRFESLNDGADVFARHVARNSLRNVIAAELNDDDIGLDGERASQPAQSLRRGAAGHSLVDDAVIVSAALQFPLQLGGV